MRQWIVISALLLCGHAYAQTKGESLSVAYDRYYAAYHAAAICNCAEPLLKYLYSLEGSIVGQAPGTYQQGGRVWLATIMVLNERWGTDLGLVGENLDLLDLALVDQLHDWVELVQVYDGVQVPKGRALRETLPREQQQRIAPFLPSLRDLERSQQAEDSKMSAGTESAPARAPQRYRILCENCADPACDSQRIANAVAAEMCNGYFEPSCLLDAARLCDHRIEIRTWFVLDLYDTLPFWTSTLDIDVRTKAWEEAEGLNGLSQQRVVPTRFTPNYGRWTPIPDCYREDGWTGLVSNSHTDIEKFTVHVIDPNTSATRQHTYFLHQIPTTGFAYQACHPRNTGGTGSSGCNCSPGGPCGHGAIMVP